MKKTINHSETAGIYRINFTEENGEEKSYVGVTKRKIKTRIKEHKEDIKFNRNKTALSKRNKKKEIRIDLENVKKLANYEARNFAYRTEALEIFTENGAINDMEHAVIDERWRSLIKKTTEGAGIGGRRTGEIRKGGTSERKAFQILMKADS